MIRREFGVFSDDYAGLQINLPAWFIKQNKLEDAVEQFKTALEGAEFSLMHPDYDKSLESLKNYKEDAKRIDEAVKAHKEKARVTRENLSKKRSRTEMIVSNDLIETVWETETIKSDFYDIRYKDRVWKEADIHEDGRMKHDFCGWINDLVDSDDFDVVEFANKNGMPALKNMFIPNCEELSIMATVSLDDDGVLFFDVSRRKAKYCTNQTKLKYWTTKLYLMKDSEGFYVVNNGNKIELYNYTDTGDELIKPEQ